jgi:hypothetical protein
VEWGRGRFAAAVAVRATQINATARASRFMVPTVDLSR